MRRRDFLRFVGSTPAWPVVAHAQQSEKVRRIGVLMAHRQSDPEFQDYLSAFRQGLQKSGWIEGRNIQIEARWGALDDAEVRQQSAREILALIPDIILTQNTPPTASVLQQTRTVPVVFVVVADPVGSGFVESLSRPGGNATGFTVMEPTTSGKWLELLKDIAPQLKRAALLFNPSTLCELLPKAIRRRCSFPRGRGGSGNGRQQIGPRKSFRRASQNPRYRPRGNA